MVALLMSVGLAVAIGSQAALAAAEESHMGKVVSAGDNKLVIVGDNGENQEFDVPDKCKITRNSKDADLDDIQEGDIVKVKAERKGVGFVAVRIEARAPE